MWHCNWIKPQIGFPLVKAFPCRLRKISHFIRTSHRFPHHFETCLATDIDKLLQSDFTWINLRLMNKHSCPSCCESCFVLENWCQYNCQSSSRTEKIRCSMNVFDVNITAAFLLSLTQFVHPCWTYNNGHDMLTTLQLVSHTDRFDFPIDISQKSYCTAHWWMTWPNLVLNDFL